MSFFCAFSRSTRFLENRDAGVKTQINHRHRKENIDEVTRFVRREARIRRVLAMWYGSTVRCCGNSSATALVTVPGRRLKKEIIARGYKARSQRVASQVTHRHLLVGLKSHQTDSLKIGIQISFWRLQSTVLCEAMYVLWYGSSEWERKGRWWESGRTIIKEKR